MGYCVDKSHKRPASWLCDGGAVGACSFTLQSCEALCAALDGAAASACQGIAFARATANPRDLALRQCILLKDIGGCSPASFAGAVFARRDTDVKRFPTHSNLAPDTCPSFLCSALP